MNIDMIEEEGVVVKRLENGRIQVVVKRSEACGSCSSKKACTMLVEAKEMLVEAFDEANARVGEKVILSLTPKVLLKASFIAYILPVIGLLVGVVAGKFLSGFLSVNPDILMPSFGLTGSALVYLFISRRSFSSSYFPTATRIITSSPSDTILQPKNIM